MMNAQLFLARVDDNQPVLDNGVPMDSTLDAPVSTASNLPPQRLANLFGQPNDLREQRWAVVVPAGKEGERLLSLIQRLKTLREQEQDGKAHVFEVPPGMDQVAASNWIKNEYRDAFGRKEDVRPRYLLILGGPDQISWDFQQMLAGEAYVGRLAFDNDAGYEVYTEKAVRSAGARIVPKAQALFHTVLDGTRATSEGYEYLMQPSIEWVRNGMRTRTFDVETMRNTALDSTNARLNLEDAANALLDAAAGARASLLFTISHGADVSRNPGVTFADRRARQGAMVLGNRRLLTADDIRNKPFLPQGVWFFFACYSAGMPTRSAYAPWLREISKCGVPAPTVETLLRALPRDGDLPFVAALPQAALANPDGPLAIVGHVDLAWSWSFREYDVDGDGRSRAERFQSFLRAFVQGYRFGVANHELGDAFRWVNTELTAAYDVGADAPIVEAPSRAAKFERVRRANLWMQRNDLGAYVLLGDPAARLPIAKRSPGIRFAPNTSKALPSHMEFLQREQDVLAVLRGFAGRDEIASQRRVSLAEVERWIDVFCAGGRQALAEDFD